MWASVSRTLFQKQPDIAMRFIAPFLLIALLVPIGCSPDSPTTTNDVNEDDVVVSGTLSYRERVALPQGSTASISILPAGHPDAAPIADTSFTTTGNVPLNFALHVPAIAIDTTFGYVLVAELTSPGRDRQWATPEPVAVLTQGAPNMLELWLFSTVEAPTEPISAEPWRRARDQGVVFRGIGQEPGWDVNIFDSFDEPGRLVFTTSYGEESYTFQTVLRETDGDGNPLFRAQGGGQNISVVVIDGQCQDIMSGEQFEATVQIFFNDQTLSGCGRFLD